MDYFVLTVASLILFAATFFSTVTGFGFALIAAPVLTMVMGPKETVVFVIIAGVIVRVIMMWCSSLCITAKNLITALFCLLCALATREHQAKKHSCCKSCHFFHIFVLHSGKSPCQVNRCISSHKSAGSEQ